MDGVLVRQWPLWLLAPHLYVSVYRQCPHVWGGVLFSADLRDPPTQTIKLRVFLRVWDLVRILFSVIGAKIPRRSAYTGKSISLYESWGLHRSMRSIIC